MLVELPGRKGIGKLESVRGDRCLVAVFHSILRTDTIGLDLSDIGRAYLSPQTRVYVQQGDRFLVGRVTNYLINENGLVDYEVRFPNGRQGDFCEVELFVRPWGAPEDPAEILAAGGAESQFLHDRRQSALRPLLALRSAAQGLTAVLSAGVDFVPHQIAAVRRVLTDPIQRYLLADEVGLGKTIEAGLIIRQHLIDNPDTEVLVSVPPHLREQWRSELATKLRLDQFSGSFECCAHPDLAHVSRSPDVLVIDEAHHLVGVKSGPLSLAAERLRDLARDVPVLLLLSATPALGEEAKFLALLNLLDPLTHPLEDLAGFRSKLERRRDIGRLILSLDPNVPALVLRQRGAELERLFADDQIVQELAPKLIAATREASDQVAGLCSALKEHVADSYRIHQRVIRSRRADAKGWEFMPRGPAVVGEPNLTHVRCEGDPNEQIEPMLAALEDWRFSALEAAAGDERALAGSASRYRDLLDAVGLGANALRHWLHAARPNFTGEYEILEALAAIADKWMDDDRIATMAESTKRLIKALQAETAGPKIVVFASSIDTAAAFNKIFAEQGDGTAVYLLTVDQVADSAKIVAAFQESRKGGILVTDRSGEEGLNLNFADAIVHLDLPLSAARLEQRIGRLDRFGRRQGLIRHRILVPSDDDTSPWAAWYQLLATGFLIFNRSISDIQFLLESLESQAFQTLLQAGVGGLNALAADFRARIAVERKSQDEQYALDRIALAEEPVEDFIEALEDAEEDERALELAVDRWLIDALQLKKLPFAWPVEDPFKFSVTNRTLIPRLPWQSELGLVDGQPLTWKRRIAAKHCDVVLLRPGTPFIDLIERFTQWDDRGTAFITYRTAPDWPGDLWIGFKLCFVIEPSIEISNFLTPTRTELAKTRRAQRYFPAREYIRYIDINGDEVGDRRLIAILERPYRSAHGGTCPPDINLGSRPESLAEIIDPSAFQELCRSVRERARGWCAAQPDVVVQISTAVRLAEEDLERRRNRLQRRQSAGDGMARSNIELIEAILPSIRGPAIRLDSMGCFIISQHAAKLSVHDGTGQP